jgi:molybdopterin synthase sulfur carrier subunit
VIRVTLPHHLRNLAGVGKEVQLEIDPPITQRALIDALEATYPALLGTVRDHGSERRRDLVRFFACGQDLSNDPPDQPLPDRVVSGEEPFRIVGAIAGG